jgi:TRAP-type C4-dicarboxylate transport system substrate-binding protein
MSDSNAATRMSRRVAFVAAVGTVVTLYAAVAPVSAASADDNKTYVMRLSTATLNDVQHEWMKRYAAAIEKKTNGRIKTELYPASQLGTIPRQIEGAQLGSIQVWVGPPEFLVGVDPNFEMLSAPGVFPSEQVALKTIRDPAFSKAFTNAGVDKGLVGLALNYTGPMAFDMRAPVRTPADLKGKKVRVLASPFQTEQMSKLGATGVAMSLGDVLPAIQQGTIDGAMSSAGVFTALKYYDAAKYLTESNHAYVFSISMVSKRWLESLPPDLQDIVVSTGKEASDEVLPWSLDFVAAQRKVWVAKGGELINFTPDDSAELMKTMAPIGGDVIKTKPDMQPLWNLLNTAIQHAE